MFAHKSHLKNSDAVLDERKIGRAHHRILYTLARHPGSSVKELLSILGLTKQSISKVMRDLRERGLVDYEYGISDRRYRKLFLSEEGRRLERSLFEHLHGAMARAYAAAGDDAVRGYWTLMQHLMDATSHERFLEFYDELI